MSIELFIECMYCGWYGIEDDLLFEDADFPPWYFCPHCGSNSQHFKILKTLTP